MQILIIQPKLEPAIEQLKRELHANPSVDIVVFPEGYLNENVAASCQLARNTNTILIGGYRNLNDKPKDRAIIINRSGEIILDRIKYSETTFAVVDGLKVGHILCDELVLQGIKSEDMSEIDLIVHPIGVGMFSDEQFEEWISAARGVAIQYGTMVIGTSHADGSFRGSGVSIPISYCIDENGRDVYISKNDVSSKVLDLQSRQVLI